MSTRHLSAVDIPFAKPVDGGAAAATREFRPTGDGYVFTLLELGIQFEVDRLRRDRQELMGELSVRCDLPGARTYQGSLSIGDFNLSSVRARQDRGKLLAERSRAPELDWPGLLEEFVQRVLAIERAGLPATLLRDLPAPPADDDFVIDGLYLPRRHPSIAFGDGGVGKSYHGLYFAGQLERSGHRTLYVDFEFADLDHRIRLERLFPGQMPAVRYVRCDRALVDEADRIRRIVREERIDYVIYDSISFACNGAPESAEVAAAYYRAVRQIGAGSLHLAHITKGENGDQKPFGSSFWFNGCRACWFIKQAEPSPTDAHAFTVGWYPRKANTGPRRPGVGFHFAFESNRTAVTPIRLADVEELAAGLPLWQRMAQALRAGARTSAALAEDLGAKVDSIERAARRGSSLFARVTGSDGIAKLALVERRPV